tara:strand:- start:496 stop:636 length:141 start_codon:yes stop_codon:yes gene_type:complete
MLFSAVVGEMLSEIELNLCAPQARKISTARQNRWFNGAILGGAGAS